MDIQKLLNFLFRSRMMHKIWQLHEGDIRITDKRVDFRW